MPLATSSYRPLRDDVRDKLRERIVGGVYAPGGRLVERTIAAELGVSRIPVREALQGLVLEGFAIDRETRGIAVRSYSPAEIAELAEVGAALELVLVGTVATDIDANGLVRLRGVLDEAQQAIDSGDLATAIVSNARFHAVLAELGSGTIAHEILAGVSERRRWLLSQHSDPAPIHAEHVALYDALVDGDRTRAQQIVKNHAKTTIEHALASEVRNPNS